MISIEIKELCCGCSACASICPKHCISMQEDGEGFLYPIVNESQCVDCGECERVCHELHPYGERSPIKVLAAVNTDEDVRMRSSSGGVFYSLAERAISKGGVVFGARFDENWQVVIDYAETLEGVKAFMGSKYVQARIETAYTDTKRFLQEGRKVLFSGTPCQIAGLHHFLKKGYDNLTTVDVICHGVSSPKVWKKYICERFGTPAAITSINFRDKSYGWSNFTLKIQYFYGDKTISQCNRIHEDPFMKAFLQNMILRPSCHNCQSKNGRSHSDITIADFWGIENVFPDMNDEKGTSVVVIHTEKGRRCIEGLGIKTKETSSIILEQYNPSYMRSAPRHPKRDTFFARIDKEKLTKVIDDCTKPTIKQRIKSLLRKIAMRIKNGGARGEK